MSADEPPSPKRFEERLRAAQEQRRGRAGREAGRGPDSALGYGFRIGVELVSALVVGVGIGWLLDWWLGTQPWLLILFFLLGAGAGVLNVYRAVGEMDRRRASKADGGSGDGSRNA
jgi:ATP synthase protein I